MAAISSFAGIEVVNGIVIGGECRMGQLYYEDRRQGNPVYGDTDQEIQAAAAARYENIKADCGKAFTLIFPKDAWTVRLYE